MKETKFTINSSLLTDQAAVWYLMHDATVSDRNFGSRIVPSNYNDPFSNLGLSEDFIIFLMMRPKTLLRGLLIPRA